MVFAADDLSRIFEKLSTIGDVTLHSSSQTSFKGGGPGLGLAIAKGIMEAHGGTIWAESPGYDEEACPGSTFHIMVPLRSSAAQKAARRNAAAEQLFEAVESDSGGPER
jgi:signal transduction histidine kinase